MADDQSNSPLTRVTQYGYANDEDSDTLTRSGWGIRDAPLVPGAIALSDKMRDQVHANPGDVIQLRDKKTGKTRLGFFADRAPESDARVDIYNPSGFDKSISDYHEVTNLGGGSQDLRGKALTEAGLNNLKKFQGDSDQPNQQPTVLPGVMQNLLLSQIGAQTTPSPTPADLGLRATQPELRELPPIPQEFAQPQPIASAASAGAAPTQFDLPPIPAEFLEPVQTSQPTSLQATSQPTSIADELPPIPAEFLDTNQTPGTNDYDLSRPANLLSHIAKGINTVVGQGEQALGHFADPLAEIKQLPAAKNIADLVSTAAQLGGSPQTADTISQVMGPNIIEQGGQALQQQAKELPTNPKFNNDLSTKAADLAGSVIPLVNPAGVPLMGLSAYQQGFDDAKTKGMDDSAATRAGLINATVTAGAGKLLGPVKWLEEAGGALAKPTIGAATKALVGSAAKGVVRGAAEGAAMSAGHQLAEGDNLTSPEAIQEDLSAAGTNAIAGGVLSPIFRGAGILDFIRSHPENVTKLQTDIPEIQPHVQNILDLQAAKAKLVGSNNPQTGSALYDTQMLNEAEQIGSKLRNAITTKEQDSMVPSSRKELEIKKITPEEARAKLSSNPVGAQEQAPTTTKNATNEPQGSIQQVPAAEVANRQGTQNPEVVAKPIEQQGQPKPEPTISELSQSNELADLIARRDKLNQELSLLDPKSIQYSNKQQIIQAIDSRVGELSRTKSEPIQDIQGRPIAPAEYAGEQELANGKAVSQYHLQQPIGDKVVGDTVSEDTLNKLGYAAPAKPEPLKPSSQLVPEGVNPDEKIGNLTLSKRNELAQSNYDLIDQQIRANIARYGSPEIRGMTEDDLHDMAITGFQAALKNYDPTKLNSSGEPSDFRSFAAKTLQQRLLPRAIDDSTSRAQMKLASTHIDQPTGEGSDQTVGAKIKDQRQPTPADVVQRNEDLARAKKVLERLHDYYKPKLSAEAKDMTSNLKDLLSGQKELADYPIKFRRQIQDALNKAGISSSPDEAVNHIASEKVPTEPIQKESKPDADYAFTRAHLPGQHKTFFDQISPVLKKAGIANEHIIIADDENNNITGGYTKLADGHIVSQNDNKAYVYADDKGNIYLYLNPDRLANRSPRFLQATYDEEADHIAAYKVIRDFWNTAKARPGSDWADRNFYDFMNAYTKEMHNELQGVPGVKGQGTILKSSSKVYGDTKLQDNTQRVLELARQLSQAARNGEISESTIQRGWASMPYVKAFVKRLLNFFHDIPKGIFTKQLVDGLQKFYDTVGGSKSDAVPKMLNGRKPALKPTSGVEEPHEYFKLKQDEVVTPRTWNEYWDSYKRSLPKIKEPLVEAYQSSVSGAKMLYNTLLGAPPRVDVYDQARGLRQESRQRIEQQTMLMARELRESIPSELKGNAINIYMSYGGDADSIRGAIDRVPESSKKNYEAALHLTDSEKAIAGRAREYYDKMLENLQQAGVTQSFVENYVNRLYEKTPDAGEEILGKLKAEGYGGKLSFNSPHFKQRFYQTLADAEAAGKRFATYDIRKLIPIYHHSVMKTLADRSFIKMLTSVKDADGRPLLAPRSKTPLELPASDQESALIKQDPIYTEDYKPIDNPAIRNWKWLEVGGVPAQLYAHPKYANRIARDLESSQLYKIASQANLGLVLRKGQELQQIAKEAKFSFSAFHQIQEGVTAAFHKLGLDAPFPVDVFNMKNITPVDLGDPETSELLRGGLQLYMGSAAAHFLVDMPTLGSGVAAKYLPIEIAGIPFGSYHDWLFGTYIPHIKTGMALQAFRRNAERYKPDLDSGKISREDLAKISAKQANDAFGGLDWAELGFHPTIQELIRTLMLAPDFGLARLRHLGGAAAGIADVVARKVNGKGLNYQSEQTRGIAAMSIAFFVAARLANMYFNQGNAKWDEPFDVVIGDKAYGVRSAVTDAVDMFKDPRKFITNREHIVPRLAQEAWTGKDYAGRPVDFGGFLKDTAMSLMPMSASKLIPSPGHKQMSAIDAIANVLGVSERDYTPLTRSFALSDKYGVPRDATTTTNKNHPAALLVYGNLLDGDLNAARNVLNSGADRIYVSKLLNLYARYPMTHNPGLEKKYTSQLSPSDKALLDEIRAQNQKVLSDFNKL